MLRREAAQPALMADPAGPHVDIVQHAAQVLVAGAHAALAVLIKRQSENPRDALLAQHAWQAHGHVGEAVLPVRDHGERQHGMRIKQHGADHLAGRQRDAGGRIALELDDVQPAGLHRADHLLPVDGRLQIKLFGKPVKRDARDVDRVPRDERRAAVLAEHKAGDALGVDAQLIGEHLVKARGVQQRAGGENSLARVVVLLPAEVRQHVDRIGHVDEDSVAGIARDPVHDGGDHLQVGLKQRHPVARLPGLDGRPGGVDDDLRVPAVLVVAHTDSAARRIGKRERMPGVQRHAQRLLAIQIDEHDLPGQIHAQKGVEHGAADVPRADDDDFSPLSCHRSKPPFLLFA